MKKLVNFNGEKIRVEFDYCAKEYNVIQKYKDCLKRRIVIQPQIEKNILEFTINGKSYEIICNVVTGEKTKYTYNFEGVILPDNHKKVIEHIISKYGI